MPKKYPTFDECYSAKPEFTKPNDFDKKWEEEIIKIKKKHLEPVSKLIIRKSLTKGTSYEIQYRGHQDNIIKGFLNIPRKFKKVPVVISVHDYWQEFNNLEEINYILFSEGIAHLHIYLYDKELLERYQAQKQTNDQKDVFPFPPLFLDTYKQPFQYDYGVFLILDLLRAIDFIRLNKSIKHDKMGILGRGLGANLAVFASAFRPESIKVLALERMVPVWFEYYIKYSNSQLAKEYQKIIQLKKSKKLSPYEFLNEPIYIADKISIPVLMSVGMEDPEHPSLPAFGFFNLLQCDKSIQIFTDEKQDPNQKKERESSLRFIIENLK